MVPHENHQVLLGQPPNQDRHSHRQTPERKTRGLYVRYRQECVEEMEEKIFHSSAGLMWGLIGLCWGLRNVYVGFEDEDGVFM